MESEEGERVCTRRRPNTSVAPLTCLFSPSTVSHDDNSHRAFDAFLKENVEEIAAAQGAAKLQNQRAVAVVFDDDEIIHASI